MTRIISKPYAEDVILLKTRRNNMARPLSVGLKYTNLDVTFFQDRKVRRLQRRYGESSPLIYIALLCAIYTEGYYIKWDDDLSLDLADATRMEEETVREVIKGCLEVGLLSQEMFDKYQILTSHGIQKQYKVICEQCKRKNTVKEYSLLVSSEETTPDKQEDEVSSEFGARSIIREKEKKEERIVKENTSSSFVPSSPGGEQLTPEEKEKEKFIYFFTFVQNFKDPGYEYERMVAYNNNPQAKKKWDRFTEKEKQSVLVLWHPEKESVQEHQKRFGEQFLSMWQALFRKLQEARAPYEVRMAALADGVRWTEKADSLTLYIPEILREYLEQYMDTFKPVIWPFLQLRGCSKLMYDRC